MVIDMLPVLAHGDEPHNWGELVRDWEWNPLVLSLLLISAALYGRGLWRLRRASHPNAGIKRWEAACFWAGLVSLFLALVSPLHAWGHVLFSAHMVQHEILMLICAPLIVLGRPLILYLWALPPGWSRAVAQTSHARPWRNFWQAISHPLSAWLL
ncbi:MAG TPA: cytochrome c oxidase assembly protein, partial [Phycisphaerae bacterium]|nr:cytochrome c oxidase assembly protein [Phycisphaerae bacterium]